jgi:hypothetical protein
MRPDIKPGATFPDYELPGPARGVERRRLVAVPRLEEADAADAERCVRPT